MQQFDSPIAWLVGFLNLKFDSGNKSDHGKIERFFEDTGSAKATAATVQARWRLRFAWLAENATLAASLAVGLEVLTAIINVTRREIDEVKNDSPRQGEIDSLQDELEKFRHAQRAIANLAGFTERKLKSKKMEVIEALHGAKFVTREDALRDLVNTLNGYSDKIKYSWQLRRATPKRLAPGQGVITANGKKFVVDRFPVGEDFDSYVALVVSKCLENGSIDRLRRCRECRAYFHAAHKSKEYCRPEHQRDHDKREAVKRAKSWRIDPDNLPRVRILVKRMME